MKQKTPQIPQSCKPHPEAHVYDLNINLLDLPTFVYKIIHDLEL